MRPHTGARSDRFSAATARLLTLLGALLAALGLAAPVFHTPFPLWGWIVTAPDMLALTVLAAVRMSVRAVPPRPLCWPFGG
jgi:hypothetical protein